MFDAIPRDAASHGLGRRNLSEVHVGLSAAVAQDRITHWASLGEFPSDVFRDLEGIGTDVGTDGHEQPLGRNRELFDRCSEHTMNQTAPARVCSGGLPRFRIGDENRQTVCSADAQAERDVTTHDGVAFQMQGLCTGCPAIEPLHDVAVNLRQEHEPTRLQTQRRFGQLEVAIHVCPDVAHPVGKVEASVGACGDATQPRKKSMPEPGGGQR